jgi:hypothetical protein
MSDAGETVKVPPERLAVVMRMLVDSGDMTPMAVRMVNSVLNNEEDRSQ